MPSFSLLVLVHAPCEQCCNELRNTIDVFHRHGGSRSILLVQLVKIPAIACRQHDLSNAPSRSCQNLFFDPAHRQHGAPQGDFSCDSHRRIHRNAAQRRQQCSQNSAPSTWSVLRYRPSWYVYAQITVEHTISECIRCMSFHSTVITGYQRRITIKRRSLTMYPAQ